MRRLIVLLVAGFLSLTNAGLQKRGVVEEFGNIFEGFANSFDHVTNVAREEVSKLKPWAENLEREMKPALSRVEERLGSALDNFGMSFGNERIDSHVMDTTGTVRNKHS